MHTQNFFFYLEGWERVRRPIILFLSVSPLGRFFYLLAESVTESGSDKKSKMSPKQGKDRNRCVRATTACVMPDEPQGHGTRPGKSL